MTEKQAEKFIKKGEYQKLLQGFCKDNSFQVKFIDLPDKSKRIEIRDGGIDLIETLQSLKPEDNFNEISRMILFRFQD